MIASAMVVLPCASRSRSRAASRSSRDPPSRAASTRSSSASSRSGWSGSASSRSAAHPVTMGAATEVPISVEVLLNRPAAVIGLADATTSVSAFVLLKHAIWSNVVCAKSPCWVRTSTLITAPGRAETYSSRTSSSPSSGEGRRQWIEYDFPSSVRRRYHQSPSRSGTERSVSWMRPRIFRSATVQKPTMTGRASSTIRMSVAPTSHATAVPMAPFLLSSKGTRQKRAVQ